MANKNITTTSAPLLLTPANFSSRRYQVTTPAALPPIPPISWDTTTTVAGERRQQQEKTFEKQREIPSSSADKINTTTAAPLLLTPAYFDSRYYLGVSPSSGDSSDGSKQEKEEFYLLPKMLKPCKTCENVCCINDRGIIVQTKCYCSDIVPDNYLTQEKTDDDIYMEMGVESDLPW